MKLHHLATRIDVKAAGGDGSIEGVGSVFGNVDDHGDVVLPGAFRKSLASGRSVKMLWQHDPSHPLGVWDEIAETNAGLVVKGRIAVDTQLGADVMAHLRMRSIDGLSIGYRTVAADFDQNTGIRSLKELELWEVSVVTFPANPVAVIESVKSLDEVDGLDFSGIEKALREAGFSRDGAKRLLHRHTALVRQREAEGKSAEDLTSAVAALAARFRAS